MAVSNVHMLAPVNVDIPGPPIVSGTIGGIVNQAINTGTQVIKESNAGSQYPELPYINAQRPAASFTTNHILQVINLLGISGVGVCVNSNVPGDVGVELFSRAKGCIGPKDSTSTVHTSYRFCNGVLVPSTLNVDHQGNATITCQLFGIWDSVNDVAPIVVTPNVVLSGVQTPQNKRWTMDYMTLNNVIVTQKTNISIDFGNVAQLEDADSDIWPSLVSVQDSAPRITLRGTNPTWFSNFGGLSGVLPIHANSTMYLKRRDIADGVPGHISITFNGLAYQETIFDGAGNATGTGDLIVEGSEDATGNSPLIFDITNVTIPA